MKKFDIKGILKNELEFPFISLLIIMSGFLLSTLIFYPKMPRYYNYALSISIGIFSLFRLIKIKKLKNKTFIVCLLIYISICTVSTFKYSPMYGAYFADFFGSYKYYLVMVMLILPYSYSKNVEDRIKILEYILAVSIMAIDVLSILNGNESGITIHKNHLGSLNVALCFIAILNIDFKKWYWILISSVSILLAAYMTIFSNSRASTLFVGLAIICFFGYKIIQGIKNKKIIFFFGLGLIILLVLVFFLKGNVILEFIFKTSDFSKLSFKEIINKLLNGRADLWGERLVECMKEDLWLGNGVFSYANVSYLKETYLVCVTEGVGFLHNILLDAFYASGIIGFAFFIAFFVSMIIYLKRNIKNPTIRTKRRILLLIIMFIYACLDMYFIWSAYLRNFFVFLELCALINEAYREGQKDNLGMENSDSEDNDLIKQNELELLNNTANDTINVQSFNNEINDEKIQNYEIESVNDNA